MKRTLGATLEQDGSCQFRVWSPRADRIDLHLTAPVERRAPMRRTADGYFEVRVEGVSEGDRYRFVIDGNHERPDPASRWQPDGVHEASAVLSERFDWSDQGWFGVPLSS